MHTAAKRNSFASAHKRRIADAVVSGFKSVWSINAARLPGSILHDMPAASGYHRKMSEVPVASPSVIDIEKQYLFQNYARFPLILTRGRGCYVYDASGKRYLDLIAGIG